MKPRPKREAQQDLALAGNAGEGGGFLWRSHVRSVNSKRQPVHIQFIQGEPKIIRFNRGGENLQGGQRLLAEG